LPQRGQRQASPAAIGEGDRLSFCATLIVLARGQIGLRSIPRNLIWSLRAT
jgi:hypothetical protein